MPGYFYTAKSFQGEVKSGVVEAKDESSLVKILRQQGYVLISASLKKEKKRKKHFQISLSFLDKVSLVEKMMFSRNLRLMIGAGVSLPRALRILSVQPKSKKFQNALLSIEKEIIKGKLFSKSLAKFPDIFSELFQNMVKVGEEGGTLEESLKILTHQMEREHELKSKIKGAMIYPAVIIGAMIGVGFLMLIMVVPKLSEVFEELGIDLPLSTRFVISLGNFSAHYWYLVILVGLGLFFLFKFILKIKAVEKGIDFLFLKLPIISSLTKKTNSAYTARTLGSLLNSGVSLVRALEITSGTLGNVYFRKALKESAKKVREGAKLSESLERYAHIYPLMIIQIVAVGEETGQTADILEKVAQFYEEQVANLTTNFASIIEPIVVLLIGGAVGFFAVSMIQPMYGMLEAM